jgi:hypothetical protein
MRRIHTRKFRRGMHEYGALTPLVVGYGTSGTILYWFDERYRLYAHLQWPLDYHTRWKRRRLNAQN